MNYVSVAVASPRRSLQISIKLALAIALVSLSFTPVQAVGLNNIASEPIVDCCR
ncbi:hypothetical protein [Nostoc sp. LEGE 12450]|uniref:hypothetical protein n=1 Tax=Nostoc sp. LEGE 12450 TaxID=1828643 RepID=UPI001882F191|nr:hypothetical protein [Nostoc sp. LEGE 12450]MBE8987232.1 hypothetical protein [Nostoc sp. LEGE 12450]